MHFPKLGSPYDQTGTHWTVTCVRYPLLFIPLDLLMFPSPSTVPTPTPNPPEPDPAALRPHPRSQPEGRARANDRGDRMAGTLAVFAGSRFGES